MKYPIHGWSYRYDGQDFDAPFNNTWGDGLFDYFVEECAKDFYDNHYGWECGGGFDLEFFNDGVSYGAYEISVGSMPTFALSPLVIT